MSGKPADAVVTSIQHIPWENGEPVAEVELQNRNGWEKLLLKPTPALVQLKSGVVGKVTAIHKAQLTGAIDFTISVLEGEGAGEEMASIPLVQSDDTPLSAQIKCVFSNVFGGGLANSRGHKVTFLAALGRKDDKDVIVTRIFNAEGRVEATEGQTPLEVASFLEKQLAANASLGRGSSGENMVNLLEFEGIYNVLMATGFAGGTEEYTVGEDVLRVLRCDAIAWHSGARVLW